MKNRHLLPSVAAGMALMLLSAGMAWAWPDNPPTAKTGAPGNATCGECHGNGSVNTQGATLQIVPPPARYCPSVQQDVIVRINNPRAAINYSGQSVNGFQMAARLQSNTATAAGTFSSAGDGRTAVQGQYINQTSAGRLFSSSLAAAEWTVRWLAPAKGTGAVRFYAAGHAANGDDACAQTGDTDDWLVQTDQPLAENQAPGVPAALAPADGAVVLTATPDLVVNEAVDPDGEALQYEFDLCTDATCSAFTRSNLIAPALGQAGWPTAGLTENATYWWRARAVDDCSENGPFTPIEVFYVNAVAENPSAVTFAAPLTDTTVFVARPEITIDNAVDPDPGDFLVYDFIVADDAGLTSVVASGSGVAEGSGGQTTWQVSADLTNDNTYYAMAQARDSVGLLGEPAYVRFSIHINTAPTQPSPNSPVDGAIVSVNPPELTTSLAADAEGDVLTYYFQLCSDGACGSVAQSSPAITTAPTDIVVAWTPGVLTENLRYFWRARAWDGWEFGPYMSPISFWVNAITEPPSAPVIVEPFPDGRTFSETDPLLIVANSTDTDPLSPPPVYSFAVYDDAGFTNLVTGVTALPQGEGGYTSWRTPVPLPDQTTYHLRVTAHDPQGNTASATASFHVDTLYGAPLAPTNLQPNGVTVSSNLPLLTATPAADHEAHYTYYFVLDTVASLDSGAARYGNGLTWPSWTVDTELSDGWYYWSVHAYDGQAFGDTAFAGFEVDAVNDPPSAPVLLSPLDGASIGTRLPVLTLNEASDPENDPLVYHFEIALTGDFVTPIRQSGAVAPDISTASWTPEIALPDNGTYYWRTKAVDQFDTQVSGPFSAPFAFTIVDGNLPPLAPTVPAPEEQPVDTDVVFEVLAALDPEHDPLTLTYEVYLDSKLEHLLVSSPAIDAASPAWRPDDVAWTRGIYYWRARAQDAGLTGPWSATTSLELTGPLPFDQAQYDLPATRTEFTLVRRALPRAEPTGGCAGGGAGGLAGLLLPLFLLLRRRLDMLSLATLTGLWGLAASCGTPPEETRYEMVEESKTVPTTATLDDVQKIFDGNCILCHSGATAPEGLVLTEPESSAIVGKAPANPIAADRGLVLVDPGQPATSFLLFKLTEPGLGEGARMPFERAALDDVDIAIIKRWVEDGAVIP